MKKIKVQGTLTERTNNLIGRREIGVFTETGEFITLEPGMKVWVETKMKTPVPEKHARVFFADYMSVKEDRLVLYNKIPDYCRLYRTWNEDEELWCVMSSFGHSGLICSRNIVLMSKKTGEIVCNGSCNDEG